ncbi:MAG: caspase family protein [Gammaproteobacteria bacterium]|nr:caspase family protein [Gammaproteobacteria bacterium]
MSRPKVKVLCVHGVGKHSPGGAWEKEWETAISQAVSATANEVELDVRFVYYDDIFAAHPVSAFDAVQAMSKLLKNGVTSLFNRRRGMDGGLRWTAGMVVQWVENEVLREQTRKRLIGRVEEFNPDVVCAHSLGSLVSYDTFTHPSTRECINDRIFVSLGSQIGNAFVAGSFRAGRIMPLTQAKHWYHLFNKEDDVFTAPLRLHDDGFTQVETYFDIPGIADHSASHYLSHKNAIGTVWQQVALEKIQPSLYAQPEVAMSELPERVRGIIGRSRKPMHRALIVGLNQYPDSDMCLEGCVNDSYLMSATLQGIGFDAENIRMVLDSRATRKGIADRLEWLLDDARPGDKRVFYYSGHGAQLASYGEGDKVDRMDESLVPYDFDWSDEKAFTDDQFYEMYSQLPYETQFMSVFDCCHSGGLTRGGSARVRGVSPPDDVRHRSLVWHEKEQLWLERAMKEKTADSAFTQRIEGLDKQLRRSLGTATRLRTLDQERFRAVRKEQEHNGPYMPILFYACKENEYAYEYTHGSVPHGAFTFSLAKNLRRFRDKGLVPNFIELRKAVTHDLKVIGNEQHCSLIGPRDWLESPVPILHATKKSRRKIESEPA